MSGADSSPSLSDDDVELLYKMGRTITQDVVGIIWETVFLSAYGVFFGVALWTIFRNPKSRFSLSHLLLLLIVVYLYLSSLTLWALNVTYWYKRAHAYFMDYPAMSLADRREQGQTNVEKLGVPMEALFMFNMIVGDSVVIWRVWAIYARMQWVVLLPVLMLLMSFAFTIIDINCLTLSSFSSQSALAGGGGVCDHAELISWAFSFATNGICTVLIGVRAWQHRKTTRALARSSVNRYSSRMSTNRILSLLVESGFIYCLFWLTQYILFVQIDRANPGIYAYELFAGMGDQISGMYPTLIIVIVNLHQTVWDADTDRATSNCKEVRGGGGDVPEARSPRSLRFNMRGSMGGSSSSTLNEVRAEVGREGV
ncbi:hypothetical protein R3P38DRAFT_2951191 [Favolaschia claudopus]|uniref:Uncharacterized protein n=1 Tax=Favolaschia claudopus TaxID=2862362 RepID=A0AAW0BFA1_9AGAR